MRYLALWCVVTVAVAGELSPPTASAPTVREVLELRMELYTQGIEFQDWKIVHLEDELQRAQSDLGRALEEERAAAQELTTQDNEGGEISLRKAEVDRELPRLRETQRAAQRRMAELNDRLVRERTRRQSLAALAEQANMRLRQLDTRVGKPN